MIQVGTNLKSIDNSGARTVRCIGVLAKYKQRYAGLGEIITVSIQKLRIRRRSSSKVKKGQVLKALIVRTKLNMQKTAISLRCYENGVVLLNKQNKLIGTRIFGALPLNLRFTKHLRLTFLAFGLLY